MTGTMIEGFFRAVLFLTGELKKMYGEVDPNDVDLAETERMMRQVEDDLSFIRRERERLRQAHSGGHG